MVAARTARSAADFPPEDRAFLATRGGNLEWGEDPWHVLTGALKVRTAARARAVPAIAPGADGIDSRPDMAELLPLIGEAEARRRLLAAATDVTSAQHQLELLIDKVNVPIYENVQSKQAATTAALGRIEMRAVSRSLRASVSIGASAVALSIAGTPALAQDEADNPEPLAAQEAADEDAIVVTGIRASLQQSLNIKREAQGVVDAISAEDIGKFPDTNLAESLQRITGVSIDRSSGEGSTVTVRGFGPNQLVLSTGDRADLDLGDGASAPPRARSTSQSRFGRHSRRRSYKSGRATSRLAVSDRHQHPHAETAGSSGMNGSIAAKAVYDTSRNDEEVVTPKCRVFSRPHSARTTGSAFSWGSISGARRV